MPSTSDASSTESLRYPLTLKTVRQAEMITAVAAVHAALVVMAIGYALIWREPTATMLGAPSLALLVAGMVSGRPGTIDAAASLDRGRALAGDAVELTVAAEADDHVPLLDVEVLPERDLEPRGATRSVLSIDTGGPVAARTELVLPDWGVQQLGSITVRSADVFQLFASETRYQITTPVRVHIREDAAATLQDPAAFRRFVGSHVAPDRSEGFDFADVRAYQPGDRLRSLNWRISARREEPWVTLRHPDRSTTVVLVLDVIRSFNRRQLDIQRRSVQAVLGLARLHSGAQDRVGLLILGAGMRWIEPSTGAVHLHVINDALLELSKTSWSKRPFNRDMMNRQVPADAHVIALSPLENRGITNALTTLKQRGRRVDVIQPVMDWRRYRDRKAPDQFASRLFDLDASLDRSRMRATGIGVFPWEIDQPVDTALRAMQAQRRMASIVAGAA